MSTWNWVRPRKVGKIIHLIDLSVKSFWIKSEFPQTRPDSGFTLFSLTPNHWGTIHPAACRDACHFSASRGENEMESRTMNSSLTERTCDQSMSLESFSVCAVTSLKMLTSQTSGAIMCENLKPIWRCWLRICRHRILINWHDVVKTVMVYAISVCNGDRKCHWIPPRTRSWRLVIRWKGSCHGDIWVL